MPACKITFSATFTEEDVLAFAEANGWSAEIEDENGDLVANPEKAIEFNTRIARSNLVTFLTIPSIKAINAEKEAERQSALDALHTSVDGDITQLIEEVVE